jgi:hypothetical protein
MVERIVADDGRIVERRPSEYLRLKIDLPSFQLELSTKDTSALGELRKVLELLGKDDQLAYEEYALEEIKSQLSSQFTANQQIMDAVGTMLKEHEFRISTTEVPLVQSIDFETDKKEVRVSALAARRAINLLVDPLPLSQVKHGIVHLHGDLLAEDRAMVVDHIHRRMPTAHLRAFHTTGTVVPVRVECVFFGDFEDE